LAFGKLPAHLLPFKEKEAPKLRRVSLSGTSSHFCTSKSLALIRYTYRSSDR
jgi:hypothetical protein